MRILVPLNERGQTFTPEPWLVCHLSSNWGNGHTHHSMYGLEDFFNTHAGLVTKGPTTLDNLR